ncbi:MAG: hypothetical protein K940chlam3_01476 [Chlamydiae bacterium]|nr:hypothetical protein [Chlamydiota bacterium]
MKLKIALMCLFIGILSGAQAIPCGCVGDCSDEEPSYCYQKCWQYCPTSVDIPECTVCPEVKYRKLKRYVTKYYKQKHIRYVPQVYYETVARCEPEYYYESYTVFHNKGSKVRCCTLVPKEVHKLVKYTPCDEEPIRAYYEE